MTTFLSDLPRVEWFLEIRNSDPAKASSWQQLKKKPLHRPSDGGLLAEVNQDSQEITVYDWAGLGRRHIWSAVLVVRLRCCQECQDREAPMLRGLAKALGLHKKHKKQERQLSLL